MNLGNFTIKAAEAVQAAQQLAFNSQNPNIETEHILKALIDQQDSPVDYLLKKNNVTINLVDNKLDELISKLMDDSKEEAITANLGELGSYVKMYQKIMNMGGVQARIPFEMDIR